MTGLKKILACAFSGIIATSCTFMFGCGGEDYTAKTFSPSQEKMRLFAYDTPPNGCTDGAFPPYGLEPDFNTVENWKILKDVGYNYAIPTWHDYTDEHIIKTLTNAQANGVKVIIEDRVTPGIPNIIRSCANYAYDDVMAIIESNAASIKMRYDRFAEFDSFAGINAMDEPSAEYYAALAAGIDWWRENYPEHEFYSNLFSSYAEKSQLFGSKESGTYRKYVEDYVSTVNPDYLSYDFYALRRSGFSGIIHPNWLCDLELYATLGKQNNIPFYLYFLTTKHLIMAEINYYREVAWQCYSAMAYGVRGLQTFSYWSYFIPDQNTNNLGTGLVDAEGKPMPCYYAVQEVFSEIRAFEDLYMSFDWEETMSLGLTGSGTYYGLVNRPEKLKGLKGAEATKDALVGQFKDKNGNLAYMVMNYASPFLNEDNKVTLDIENASHVLVCKKGKKIVEKLDNGKLELDMACGEGFFVIPL